jgi:membrane protease YdiL (CAAX protease family)
MAAPPANLNLHKISLFLGLTFGGSWLVAGIFYALDGRLQSPLALPVLLLFMFMPMTMALVVQKLVYKQPLVEPLGISFKLNRWFLVAWLLPVLFALGALGVALLFPGVEYAPDLSGLFEQMAKTLPPEQVELARQQIATLPIHVFWISLASALVAGPTINAVAGFGEELGWRGLLQRELAPLGFWKSSLLIGLFWGLWHAPIIAQGYNYPQHPMAGVLMMTALTLLLSPLFSYVRLKTQSVIAAAVMHGSLNASGGLAILVLRGGDDLTVGVSGLAGLLVLGAMNLCLLAARPSVPALPGARDTL